MNASHTLQDTLKSSELFLFSWNVLKGKREGWHEDFYRIAAQADLVLFQEALLHDAFYDRLGQRLAWQASAGYSRFNRHSGVLTAATANSYRTQRLQQREPVLRSPKAALITEYALLDSPRTLLVANIHAINFTWGLKHFQQQLDEVFAIIAAHSGPVLLAGDFNVWRGKRMQLVQALARSVGMMEMDFEQDHRTMAFKYPLDHIFYKGLIKKESAVHKVTTSDHNPITALFSVLA